MTFRKNWKIKSFNSRSRKEIDISYCPRRAGLLLFQLTTSRRGRHFVVGNRKVVDGFNSRPHEEVDLPQNRNRSLIKSFNSRPHEEVDIPPSRKQLQVQTVSTHDLTKRSTRLLIGRKIYQRCFNSRPHEEVDVLGLVIHF